MSVNNLGTFLNIKDSHLRVVSGNVYAQGINIGGITVDVAHGLQSITNQGNVTTNTLQFDNATTAFTTTANATVGRDLTVTGNATVSSNLTVTGNAVVSDDLTVTGNAIISDDLTVTGNTFYTNPAAVLVDSNVVTEYTGPHDRPLRKYPEVAMTSASQSGYIVTPSTQNGSSVAAYYMFDGDRSTRWRPNANNDVYDISSPFLYNGSRSSSISDTSGTTHDGVFLKLELPKAIKLDYTVIRENSSPVGGTPGKITFLGSTNGTDWTFLKEFSGMSSTALDETYAINETNYYNHFAFVVKNLSDARGELDLGEWELYGHEEGSGSLDTTLKSVYNVPATTGTQLEVYYDAKDLTTMPATVTDLSPNSNGGSVAGATLDTTDGIESFKFIASSSQYIEKVFSGYTQSAEYSASVWFKSDSYTSDSTIFQLGLGDHNDGSGFGMNIESEGPLRAYIYGYGSSSQVSTSVDSIATGTWYHATATYYSSGKIELYVNGVLVGEGKATQLGTINASAPLTLGTYYLSSTRQTPSFNGSIANFRLYSKVLNADQIKELYDYQKDYFLGSKSQVTLYKGHLGVGVTEPSGQLELAGDERIQEYPPRGLVGDPLVFDPAGNAYDYNVEGHGVFKVSSSTLYHASTSDDRRIYRFFDHNDSTFTHWNTFNGSSPYEATTNAQITTLDGGSTITAHFAEIQMPYKITLKKYNLRSSSQLPRALKTGMIVGSNDGNVYHVLHNVPDFGFTATFQTKEYTVDNATTPYRIFRLLLMNTVGNVACNMNEWRLFGTPGPTTLDKGSLSLTRSLDVPRVSRYDVDTETPRPEKLVLDFDTTVNESPTDISGKGNHGKFVNGASYSPADKAFTFDGTTDTIEGVISGISGDYVHSISFWGNFNTTNQTIFEMGSRSNNDLIGINYTTGSLNYYFFANDYVYNGATQLYTWNHFVFTYSGGGTSRKVFLNGVELGLTSSNGAAVNQSLTLANGNYSIGDIVGSGSGSGDVNGKISNFKLYSVALEPSEVKKLYNLGRTGRSMVISDTAVGIGKVPEAQLDVRGNLNVSSFIKYDSGWFYAFNGGSNGTGATFNDYTGFVPWGSLLSGSKHFTTASASTSGGYYTAPVDGIYHFDTSILNYPDTRIGISGIFFSVNNNAAGESNGLGYNRKTNMPGQESMNASATFRLNEGDTVKVYVANIDCYTETHHAFFSGYLVTRI